MASSKGILRSLIVLALVLGIGVLGLWFLSGTEIKIKNPGSGQSSSKVNNGSDQFSDFGGKTPEETLKLFIKALETNDLILAVKYFTPEIREVESEDLTKLYNFNLLSDLTKDLKNIKSGKILNKDHYRFEVFDEAGQTATEIELQKNKNGLWKIISF